jgi:ribonucleotide reductase alpha subunit
MCRYSNTIREVGQEGRRGAEMLSISIHHPESVIPWDPAVDGDEFETEIDNKEYGNFKISSKYFNPKKIDFATSKYDTTKVTGANISLRLTDEFLSAVDSASTYEQRWPVDKNSKKIAKIVNAKNVWDKIIHSAWRVAEPGLLFWDRIISESPADCYSKFGFATESTNPCVTADTWILTTNGPAKVSELIGTEFVAIVDGQEFPSDSRGFWETGNKEVYELMTDSGMKVECTENHEIQIVTHENRTRNLSWKPLKDIEIGDKIAVHNHERNSWESYGCYEEGYLLGSLTGDGCICDNTAYLSFWGSNKVEMLAYVSDMLKKVCKVRSDVGSASEYTFTAINLDSMRLKATALKEMADNYELSGEKNIGTKIEKASSDFNIGFLKGWFDADGTVLVNKNGQRNCVRLCSINLSNLYAAQRMLARLGVISKVYPNRREAGTRFMPDGKGGQKEYYCQAMHELCISKSNIARFEERIGFADPAKAKKLQILLDGYKTRGLYQEKFSSEVVSIKKKNIQKVYDCHIPVAHRFDANGLVVHNCAELPLCPGDSCRLLVLNLMGFVKEPFSKNAYFDYEMFYDFAKIAQRLMDDIVDIEEECIKRIIDKVASDPEPADIKQREMNLWKQILKMCLNGRRTGTGVTAVGDTLAALNVSYGSDEGIEIISRIYKTLKFAAYESSVEMAEKIGPFPIWDYELEKDNPFLNRIASESVDLGNGNTIQGKDIYNRMKKVGRRNIALLTTAPVGSISIMAKNVRSFGTSSGIEPQYSDKPYTRRRKVNPTDEGVRIDFVDQNGDSWQNYDVLPQFVTEWMNLTGNTDATKSPWHNNCAEDINWEKRVILQAEAGKHVDHSISSTVNLPADVSVEEVDKIYRTAWKKGCKGITVYRDGCRTGILVKKESGFNKNNAPKRPKTVDCDIYHTKSRGEDFFVLVGLLNGHPYEIFAGKNGCISHEKKGKLTKNKRGHYSLLIDDKQEVENVCDLLTDEQAVITRLISLSLRHGSDISFVVDQLEKSHGDMTNFGKALARVLKKYIKDGTKIAGRSCESCGSENVIRQEGCASCKDCGSSKCS